MVDPELRSLVLMGIYSTIGLLLGIFIKLNPAGPRDLSYVLRRGAKYGGWVMGVLGLITTIVGTLELTGALKW
jgi:hypothetical protein